MLNGILPPGVTMDIGRAVVVVVVVAEVAFVVVGTVLTTEVSVSVEVN